MEGFLSPRQAAERSDVTPTSMYRWLDNPDVPLTKHKTGDGRVWVNVEELDAWNKARRTPVAVPPAKAS